MYGLDESCLFRRRSIIRKLALHIIAEDKSLCNNRCDDLKSYTFCMVHNEELYTAGNAHLFKIERRRPCCWLWATGIRDRPLIQYVAGLCCPGVVAVAEKTNHERRKLANEAVA
jgi:hypothetical protein